MADDRDRTRDGSRASDEGADPAEGARGDRPTALPRWFNVLRAVVPAACLVLAVVAAAVASATLAMVFLGTAMVTGIVDLWIHIGVASHRDLAGGRRRRASRPDRRS